MSSADTLQAGRKWDDIFKVLKGKKTKSEKLFLNNEKEIKHFQITKPEGVHHC